MRELVLQVRPGLLQSAVMADDGSDSQRQAFLPASTHGRPHETVPGCEFIYLTYANAIHFQQLSPIDDDVINMVLGAFRVLTYSQSQPCICVILCRRELIMCMYIMCNIEPLSLSPLASLKMLL